MIRFVLVLVAAGFFAGCETTAVRTAAAEVEQAAIMANDLQLKYSTKGMCSSSFTAVMRAYAGHPRELRAFSTLCGVDDSVIEFIIEATQE